MDTDMAITVIIVMVIMLHTFTQMTPLDMGLLFQWAIEKKENLHEIALKGLRQCFIQRDPQTQRMIATILVAQAILLIVAQYHQLDLQDHIHQVVLLLVLPLLVLAHLLVLQAEDVRPEENNPIFI